jgi:hypothetical protein
VINTGREDAVKVVDRLSGRTYFLDSLICHWISGVREVSDACYRFGRNQESTPRIRCNCHAAAKG